MKFSPALAAALFMPAAAGLLYQAVQPHPWPHRVLAIALLLAIFEQAHMARVDLRNVEAVEQRLSDPRLKRFRQVVIWTVAGQLVGFYGAAIGYLGWGMAIILLSVISFNLVATLRLEPTASQPIQAAGWRSRLDVLSLDAIALTLACLWIAQHLQNWVAVGMFAITALYGASKLVTYTKALGRPPSPIHIAHAAQEHPQTPQQN
ncbi:hypothetical protein IQ265_04565 [Nodosilinea sp. LEGE 06152]|uniref:hypothetical protein n=1 Tax=Nodosilinea sp. LEGE 06152 TaxID=2777966 RepID=UPI00187F95CE|nr:hypothetical protein [Nodosilinea sp. LEGE 06152]MBE9156108.1 hypothetical protein [Nodosilinea sp. LEGE 06152]